MRLAIRDFNSNRKGQSAVEYLLLLTVIAGTVWILNEYIAPKLAPILEEQKQKIENRAMRGNPQPVVAEPQIQNYYVNQNKRVEVK